MEKKTGMTKVKQSGKTFEEAGFKVGDRIMVTKDTSPCGFYPVGEIITLEQGDECVVSNYGENPSRSGFNGYDCVGYLVKQTYQAGDFVRVVARHVDRGYVAHGEDIGSVGWYVRFDDTGEGFDSQLVHFVEFDDAIWWLADDEIKPYVVEEEDTYEEEEEEIVVGQWYLVDDSNEHMADDADRVATDEDGEVVAFMFEEQEKEQEKKYRFVVWSNSYGEIFHCYPCEDGSAIYIDQNGFAKKASRSWETLVAQADFKA